MNLESNSQFEPDSDGWFAIARARPGPGVPTPRLAGPLAAGDMLLGKTGPRRGQVNLGAAGAARERRAVLAASESPGARNFRLDTTVTVPGSGYLAAGRPGRRD